MIKAMSLSNPKTALMADNVPWIRDDIISAIYGETRLNRIRRESDLYPVRITSDNLDEHLSELSDLEVIFSCWRLPPVLLQRLEQLPNLKAIFYASGSVANFAVPILQQGIHISSGMSANSMAVAEFCLGQILLSCKGYWQNTRTCRQGPWNQSLISTGPGVYGEKVGLIGLGTISRLLLKQLNQFELEVLAAGEGVVEAEALALGASEVVDLETCFSDALVVSNHMVDHPDSQRVITEAHFSMMREGATFINTGRGAQVDEEGLAQALKNRPDLTALLDVQWPEPPEQDSEFYRLPNVHMTSHIAGSINGELRRMADYVIDDFIAWKKQEETQYHVPPELFLQAA